MVVVDRFNFVFGQVIVLGYLSFVVVYFLVKLVMFAPVLFKLHFDVLYCIGESNAMYIVEEGGRRKTKEGTGVSIFLTVNN